MMQSFLEIFSDKDEIENIELQDYYDENIEISNVSINRITI